MAADRDDGEPADATPSRPAEAARPEPPDRLSRPDAPVSGELEGRPSHPPDAGPELRERQLAEHARYRLVVEATIAREKWARAAPELEAEWTEHKQRYPAPEHQEARTQADGGWLGNGGRRLTPEQNAEAAKCAADLRDEARQSIRPAMERIEAADPGRKLAGLEHMLKGEDRLKEKVADALRAQPELAVRQATGSVPDPIRFTLCYSSERYAGGVTTDIERLKSEGFELIKLKNLWHSDQYKGINSQWQAPATGTRVEVQFHTAESLEAKELTHEAYERIRGRAVDPAERRELLEFQRRANTQLATPPGTPEIEDFPRKAEDNDA